LFNVARLINAAVMAKIHSPVFDSGERHEAASRI